MTNRIRVLGSAFLGILLSSTTAAASGGWVPFLTPTLQGTTSCEPQWDPAFGVQPGGPNEYVNVLCTFDDGNGPALYMGGSFTSVGGVAANRIAKWDGSNWTPLGSGMNGHVDALVVFDDGTGPALYVGGAFSLADGVSAKGMARWDGSSFSPLGLGLNGGVSALAVFDDGTGPALYVGGIFGYAIGSQSQSAGIARWDGANWSGLGTGLAHQGSGDLRVMALTVFDDGSGPALFAGGQFEAFASTSVPTMRNLAKWDGAVWSVVGGGASGRVDSLAVFDDGSGPALYAGAAFLDTYVGLVRLLGRWNGSNWSALGSGFASGSAHALTSLTVFDDGTGSALYAGGFFTAVGGMPANNVARWDGSNWTPLPFGASSQISAGTVFDDGSGPALYVGGYVQLIPQSPSITGYLARWGSPCAAGTTYCLGDGSALACPCANESAPSDRAGCRNSSGLGATLRASGHPSLAQDTLQLIGASMPDGPLLYFQGTAISSAVLFGDGVKCTGRALIRLGIVFNQNNASMFPGAGLPLATAGLVTAPGTRHYQARYRDSLAFCTADTFNYTNGVSVTWTF